MSFASGENTVDQNDIVRYNFGYHTLNGFNDSSFVCSDNNNRIGEEAQTTHFWLNSPRCIDDNHDSGSLQGSIVGPHQIYTPVVSYISSSHDDGDRLHLSYDCDLNSSVNDCQSTRDLSTNEQILTDHLQQFHHSHTHSPPFVRVVKRRTTANKKERRRTQSINNAYADLRDCINVPADTKLSKIKTLRLALSYISYLTGILGAKDDDVSVIGGPLQVHQANYQGRSGQRIRKPRSANDSRSSYLSEGSSSPAAKNDLLYDEHHRQQQLDQEKQSRPQRPQSKASKGRTGWPQHLWAMELKQQQSY